MGSLVTGSPRCIGRRGKGTEGGGLRWGGRGRGVADTDLVPGSFLSHVLV